MRSVGQLVALARLTALEAVRQPVVLLLAAACVVATGLVPMLLMHNLGEPGRMARDGGLAFHLTFGVLIAGYASCSTLARERSAGTAATVLSKSVSRRVFFLAKFCGVTVVVLWFSLAAGASTLLAERIAEKFHQSSELVGYATDWRTARWLLAAPAGAFALAGALNLRGRPFQSVAFLLLAVGPLAVLAAAGCFNQAGAWSPYDLRVDWRLLPATILVTAALPCFAAIALALSTRLPMAPTMTGCVLVLLAGLLSAHVLGPWASRNALFAAVSGFVPDWQVFWRADDLAGGGRIAAAELLRALAYGVAYAVGALCVGCALFERTEVNG